MCTWASSPAFIWYTTGLTPSLSPSEYIQDKAVGPCTTSPVTHRYLWCLHGDHNMQKSFFSLDSFAEKLSENNCHSMFVDIYSLCHAIHNVLNLVALLWSGTALCHCCISLTRKLCLNASFPPFLGHVTTVTVLRHSKAQGWGSVSLGTS